jgi:hypothetical protein
MGNRDIKKDKKKLKKSKNELKKEAYEQRLRDQALRFGR